MNIDNLSIDTIRMLALDTVQKANSGHPGMPLGAAPMAYVLWTKFLRFNSQNPYWSDRDRFVLSAGHGSALLYALLHLTGYDLHVWHLIKKAPRFGLPDEHEKPLGIQILSPRAGELLSEWVAVLNGGVKLSTLAGAVHPYPTLGEINKKVVGNFYSSKIFSDKVRNTLKFFFSFKGRACG